MLNSSQALREEVRSWRRPDDEFIYELVVVSSGEEAVLAARLNTNLQACVIRRRFAHQILASLDLGRRQVDLEGYELVQKQLEYAVRLRDAIDRRRGACSTLSVRRVWVGVPGGSRVSWTDDHMLFWSLEARFESSTRR